MRNGNGPVATAGDHGKPATRFEGRVGDIRPAGGIHALVGMPPGRGAHVVRLGQRTAMRPIGHPVRAGTRRHGNHDAGNSGNPNIWRNCRSHGRFPIFGASEADAASWPRGKDECRIRMRRRFLLAGRFPSVHLQRPFPWENPSHGQPWTLLDDPRPHGGRSEPVAMLPMANS